MNDREYLMKALNEAKKAYKKEEVPIGAIIVKDDKIIARAHNLRENKNSSLAHAEILCIEKACKKLNSCRLDGCVMYVTLEPCAMCAGAINQSRISKIFFGARDHKNGCIGSVCNILDENLTVKVKYEYLEETQCSSILSDFFRMLRKNKKNKDLKT